MNQLTKIYILTIIFFISLCGKSSADTGIHMLEIKCDKKSDIINISPFILWNGDLEKDEVKLKDPEKNPIQKIGDSTYYYFKSLYGDENKVKFSCKTKSRSVDISVLNKALNIEEKCLDKNKVMHINLDNEIKSAWDVYGPTCLFKSVKPENWEMCIGNEGDEQINCKTIVL